MMLMKKFVKSFNLAVFKQPNRKFEGPRTRFDISMVSCRVHKKLHVLVFRKNFYQTDMLLVCISDEIALSEG